VNEPLVYMHIPKTGGMSIDVWINNSFSPDVFGYPSNYIQKDEVEVPKRAKFVVGHAPSTLEGNYVTVLRDPAERVASLYYAHMVYGDFPLYGLSLREYVIQAPYEEIDNGMVRRLAGCLDLSAAIRRLKEFAFVGWRPTDLVQWIVKNYGPNQHSVYKAMNINRNRPILSESDRAFILERNQLDRELFKMAQECFR
jgi:hypothetical protein